MDEVKNIFIATLSSDRVLVFGPIPTDVPESSYDKEFSYIRSKFYLGNAVNFRILYDGERRVVLFLVFQYNESDAEPAGRMGDRIRYPLTHIWDRRLRTSALNVFTTRYESAESFDRVAFGYGIHLELSCINEML
jgi:hypothetical protein